MELPRLVALSLCLLLPASGLAGKAGGAKKEARRHFLQAEAHYKLGRFQQALKEYGRAYELAPLPGFLFNIGQCHRKLGNDEKAVFFYKGYLRDKPKAKNRSLVLKLIQAAERRLDKARQEANRREQRRLATERRIKETVRIQREKERLRLEQERLKEEQRRLALERERQQMASTKAARTQPPPQAHPEPSLVERWWFWAAVGSVVALAAGGAIYAANLENKLVLPSGNLGTLDLR